MEHAGQRDPALTAARVSRILPSSGQARLPKPIGGSRLTQSVANRRCVRKQVEFKGLRRHELLQNREPVDCWCKDENHDSQYSSDRSAQFQVISKTVTSNQGL